MKAWRQKILPTILTGTLTVSFAAAVSAKGNNGNGNGNGNANKQKGNGHSKEVKVDSRYFQFTDLKKHWAENTVKVMVDKSIIKGYPDHTFRPNKPVTQLEALTMVINLLTQNEDLLTDDDFYYGGDIPDWAEDTVKLALVNHIVDAREFSPNKPATRLFVVKLLVNALGADFDDVDDSKLYFGDITSLTSEEKEYLSYALLQSLVAGYEDKTFKPNKPVTRAEMAVFVNRLLGKVGQVDFGNHVKGTISDIDVDDEELTIGSKTYEVADDVTVKINGKSSSFDSLSEGMKIDAILKDGEIRTIYAYGTSQEYGEVKFAIEKISDGYDSDELDEAVKTGWEVRDSTPDLSDKTMWISLNGGTARSIDLSEIDGTQKNGGDVAEALEEAIGRALGKDDRVEVSYDSKQKRFVFKTDNSPDDKVPSIKLAGSALSDLGMDNKIAEGHLGKDAAEAWKITVKSKAPADQKYVIKVEDEHLEETVEVNVDDNDTAEEIADKIADALKDNNEIYSAYKVEVDDETVTLTSRENGEDLGLEIKISKK